MSTGTFRRLGFYIIGTIIVLILLGLLAAWMYVRAGFPTYEGDVSVAGLSQEVRIERNERGAAFITAQHQQDLYFAQGYAHAQERLWQMDFQRRVVQGRLSEIFGEDQLDADRFLRTIGLNRIAQRILEYTSDEGREVLQSYADGVNAYLRDANSLPLEFRVLGFHPERWEPVHSTAVLALMAYNLGDSWRAEALRTQLQEALDDTLFQHINPPYDLPTRPVMSDADIGSAMASLHERSQLNGLVRHLPSTGSNSWVIAPERSASGHALLGNDPHLALNMPVLWYENRLTVPGEMNVHGWSIPGGPSVVIGHNEAVAWGFTNTGDTQDLFIEDRHPENPHQFREGDEWYTGEVMHEEIHVDGRDEPVTHQVHMTRNGPLVELSPALSLRWTAYDVEASTIDALIGINQAPNWEAFRHELQDFVLPAQNVVFADTTGTIAFRTVGDVPIRGEGEGLMPLRGDDPEHDWQGMIEFDEMPEIVNPSEGFIATANHRVETDDFPLIITREHAAHYRMQRIVNVLEADGSLSIDAMGILQNDWYNMLAEERLPSFLDALRPEIHEMAGAEQEGFQLLENWLDDPVNRQEYAAPALFQTWYVKLIEEIFRREMGENLYHRFLRVSPYVVFNATANVLNQDASPWLPDGLDSALRRTYTRAVEQLESDLGRNPEDWRWDEVQKVHLEHVMGESRIMRPLVNRGPYPYGGDHVTVGRAGYRLDEPFKVVHGAGLRFLAEMSSPVQARGVIAGGQSGHPRHSYYDDQIEHWLEGRYFDISAEPSERKILRLRPE